MVGEDYYCVGVCCWCDVWCEFELPVVDELVALDGGDGLAVELVDLHVLVVKMLIWLLRTLCGEW